VRLPFFSFCAMALPDALASSSAGQAPPMRLESVQSALAPASPEAQAHAELAWVLFGAAAVILVAVMAFALYAVLARRERAARLSPRALIVGGGIVFPAVVLAALLVWSLGRMNAFPAVDDPAALRIEVTGEQWWWRVRYLDAEGRADFETANEIRVPAGRPVVLSLESADVIHSFWVPSLAGKLDMIPGRVNRLRIVASRPGEYRGQCAEYCGGPHAFMAFFVVAQEAQEYERWAEGQRRPARATHELFESRCSACHTVRGTAASGTLGPDLTHVGSRRTIGAALLPMNLGSLAGWIASSQHLKPGNLMPSFRALSGEELRSLAAYLEGLE
jgi:cytochrome c oxidase subunit 2